MCDKMKKEKIEIENVNEKEVKEVLQRHLTYWMEAAKKEKTKDFDGLIEEICEIAGDLNIKL